MGKALGGVRREGPAPADVLGCSVLVTKPKQRHGGPVPQKAEDIERSRVSYIEFAPLGALEHTFWSTEKNKG